MISVVIPVHNRHGLIGRAIDSVLNQSFNDFEVIVVDDGSDDGTPQHVKDRYAGEGRVRLLSQSSNRGVSAARNAGSATAAGEWLAFLDSDDEWRPKKLDRQVRGLADSGLRVSHTDEIWIRNGVRVNPHKHHQKHGGRLFLKALPQCVMSPSSILLHRVVFDDVGPFDENLPACEDYDLFLQLTCRYEVHYLDEELVIKYGGHADQLSRAHYAMDRFRISALERVLVESSAHLTEEERDAAVAMLLRKARIVYNGALRHENEQLAQSMSEFRQRWE